MFPLLIDESHIKRYGKYELLQLNPTSHEVKRDEDHIISFKFPPIKKDPG
jgi:hypothetical protein